MGTNILTGTEKQSILAAYKKVVASGRVGINPPKWDDRAAERIWQVLLTQ
jgi:hypothetical protein